MKMQRIRDLREDNDLKQTDIADYLHISQRTYSHYETDSRSMPIEVLKRLAVYYNILQYKHGLPGGTYR